MMALLREAGAGAVPLSGGVADAGAGEVDVLLMTLREEADLVTLREQRAASPGVPVLAVLGEATSEGAALEAGAAAAIAEHGLDARVLALALELAQARAGAARERRAHRRELRTLFDLDARPALVFDLAGPSLVAANRAAVEEYGYSEAELRTMTLRDLRVPVEGGQAASADVPAAGAPSVECHRRRDGSTLEVEVLAQDVPLRGRVLRLVHARDVSLERRAMRALESSERRFRDVFEHSTGFICIHELDGTVLSLNPAAAAALGKSAAEVLGTPIRNLGPPELRFLFDKYLQRIAANGEDAGYMRVQARDGVLLVWQYYNRVYTDPDGSAYVMGYAQDITAIRAAEEAFRLSERRLRTITDTLPIRIAYIDSEQRIVFANEAYRAAYALGDGDILGRPVRDVLGERRYAERLPYLQRAFAGERVVFEVEQGENEDYRCIEITFIPELSEKETQVIGVHAMLQDVTSKKREEQRLLRLARVDSLTGLLNRTGFYERLDNAIARSRDQQSLLAVFYLDIDRFKQVNDVHGHAVGDALLRAFAARLAEKTRASDVVARLGGDEFTLIVEALPDAGQAAAIGGQLVEAMQRPFELGAESLTLAAGTSLGIAVGRAIRCSAVELVAHADAMLYAAKQAGRGTWRMLSLDGGDRPRQAREKS